MPETQASAENFVRVQTGDYERGQGQRQRQEKGRQEALTLPARVVKDSRRIPHPTPAAHFEPEWV